MPANRFGQQISGLDTEALVAAYQGQRNPFNTANKLAGSGQDILRQELERRGVQTTGLRVTPGGKVLRNTGLRSVGKAVGGVLKTVAPIGAALIPGLGPVAAGLLAAGGSAAGRALTGERFNLGKTALAGAVGGVGSAVLGGEGLKGLGTVGGRLGSAVQKGGVLSRLGGAIASNPERAARLGLGAIGAVQAAQAAGRQRRLEEEALQRGPVFGGPTGAYTDVGNPYAPDEGNPYSATRRRQGQAALTAELSR